MTEQEFYIWLLNCASITPTLPEYSIPTLPEYSIPKFPEYNPEFLKNYEIAKLILDKFGIQRLNENQQRNLNLEAASNWFRVSGRITLRYDIPEILELLPERTRGYLNLKHSEIKSLPQLKSVGGYLNLSYSNVQSLPKLESVGGRIYTSSNCWKNYFRETGRSYLAGQVRVGL